MTIFNFLVYFLVFLYVLYTASANLLLIGNNISIGFNDFRANFAPAINPSGKCGVLHLADPTDACSSLNFKMLHSACECSSPFVLIERGGCSFEVKVRQAQAAGFKAAIVYDNEDDGVLVAMAGNPVGIKINAVFISKVAGGIIRSYIGVNDTKLWIYPSFENSAWSIMAISFLSLLAMAAVFTACFIIRRRISRRDRPMLSRLPESHGMSGRLVKAMPSLIFTSALEDNCTSTTCAICLEDYSPGENLRLLPCLHKFHSVCVDSWLTSWRTFCPVCKQDARGRRGCPPPSESTPLLLWSNPPSALSSFVSSFSSSSSSALQAASALSFPNPAWAPPLAANWGSLSHDNTSPCHLASFRSLCCPSIACLSASHLYPNSLSYSESAPRLSSPLSSANSLPPC